MTPVERENRWDVFEFMDDTDTKTMTVFLVERNHGDFKRIEVKY